MRTSPRNAQTTRDPHYANSTKKLAQFQMQLETKATTKPKIVVIASKVAEQYHLARRGRVTCEEALRGLLTIAYVRDARTCGTFESGRNGGLAT